MAESVQENQENEDIDGIAEDTTKNKYLTFDIDNEVYGISIAFVKEIINMCDICYIPETVEYVKGIINLRGDIIPVISVRNRFLKMEKEYDELTCIVVVEYRDLKIGLIIDNVEEVIQIPENNIIPPPNAKLTYHNQFIKSIGQVGLDVKLLLDLDKFLEQE